MGSKDTVFSLNGEELSLLSDPSFFIKKKLVTNRIVDLFGLLESDYKRICEKHSSNLPDALLLRRGKISRGENYRGLPYVILDYPAIFRKEGVFAFRTLMWWGNAFSFTFHLSGCYLDQYLVNISSLLHDLDPETLICINSAQWEHHHETTNFIPIHQFLNSPDNNPYYFTKRGFMKLSKVVPFSKHEIMVQSGIDFLDSIIFKLK